MNSGFKQFRIENYSCYLPNDLAISYALPPLLEMQKIILVGLMDISKTILFKRDDRTIKLYKN